MTNLLLLSSLLLFLSACMHKSVMEGVTDDVVKSYIYNFKDDSYLITIEKVFQATSKKSNGGFTSISGYNDLRITTYDLFSGKRICRKKIGREQKNAIVILGITEDNIWFYSKKEGLHSRDPKTLEIKITQDKITDMNPDLKDNFADCEWYQLKQFFSFSHTENKLIVSDKQGFRYLINPSDLKAEKLSDNFKFPVEHHNNPFENTALFEQQYITFKGDLRKEITLDSKSLNSDLTFLDGKFIIDNNMTRLTRSLNKNYMECKSNCEKLKNEFDNLIKEHGPDYWKFKGEIYNKYRHLENSIRDIETKKDNCERQLKSVVDYGKMSGGNLLLMPDSITFFVIHKKSTAKDAWLNISKLQLKNNTELIELWKTEIDNIFYDYNAARETSSFKVVFSKGNPSFDYIFVDLINNKLVMIYMLHMFCLDVSNGKILWKFRM